MGGFVAIIAEDPSTETSEIELAALGEAYAAVRGEAPATDLSAAARARARVFHGPDAAVDSVVRRGESWAAVGGVAQHRGPLLDTPLEDLDGQFALLRHDAAAQELALASDPLGMFGLFVAPRDGRTYASTCALALARHLEADPDRLGVLTFLRAGYHCGSRTSWEGVERVPAGTALEFGAGGVCRRRYWRPEVDPAIRRLGLAQSVDRCVESAIEAVRMAAGPRQPVWCDLTGGHDTRFLALLARAAGIEFMTNTSVEADVEDVELARRVAVEAGWDWVPVRLPEPWSATLPDQLDEALGWGDCALDVLVLSDVLWRHRLKAQRSRRLLNGGGGEHYWSFAWQQEYGRSRRSGHIDLDTWVRLRMLNAMGTDVFVRDPTPDVAADLSERMETALEPYLDQPRAVQADYLYAHKVTGHFGAFAAAGGAELDVLLPFYTRTSFSTAFSVDPRHRHGHRLYRRLIERLDPRLAAIPTTSGGPAQPLRLANLRAFAPFYARVGKRVLNKLAQHVVGRSAKRPHALGDSGAATARDAAVARVGSDLGQWRSLPLYDDDRLARFLADAGSPAFGQAPLLGRILTTELGLRATGASLGD